MQRPNQHTFHQLAVHPSSPPPPPPLSQAGEETQTHLILPNNPILPSPPLTLLGEDSEELERVLGVLRVPVVWPLEE